jgi:hypothetical protein
VAEAAAARVVATGAAAGAAAVPEAPLSVVAGQVGVLLAVGDATGLVRHLDVAVLP